MDFLYLAVVQGSAVLSYSPPKLCYYLMCDWTTPRENVNFDAWTKLSSARLSSCGKRCFEITIMMHQKLPPKLLRCLFGCLFAQQDGVSVTHHLGSCLIQHASDGWAWIFSSNRLNEVQRQKGCTSAAVWYLSNREQPLLISKHLYIISAELCAEQKDLHHSIRHVNSIQFFMEAATGFGWPFRKPPPTVDDPHWGCVSSLHEY